MADSQFSDRDERMAHALGGVQQAVSSIDSRIQQMHAENVQRHVEHEHCDQTRQERLEESIGRMESSMREMVNDLKTRFGNDVGGLQRQVDNAVIRLGDHDKIFAFDKGQLRGFKYALSVIGGIVAIISTIFGIHISKH